MKEKIIQQGAEAVIFLKNDSIVKRRIKKNYRIKELDRKLRLKRTKSEAKIINKLKGFIFVPEIKKIDKENFEITMDYIEGKKLSENLDELNYNELCLDIGKEIAKIHNKGIIHGDLTTSNMILKNNKVYFIDFGLGFHSNRIEDMAVDLHLLKQALDAKHFNISEVCFDSILRGYKWEHSKEVIDRIGIIELRGRYKNKH